MELPAIGSEYRRDRRRLVEHLQGRGVNDLAVLHAFASVPRHHFVPEAVRHRAYEDVALPLGHGQTISRPGVHAAHLTLAELDGSEKVLEVGTGSGYQTALLADLATWVYSIEVVSELGRAARDRIESLALGNVSLRVGDGSLGWPEGAPFDVILVGAAAPAVPPALVEQLAEGGRMLLPVGDADGQRLLRIERVDGEIREEEVDRARFVPLTGEAGW